MKFLALAAVLACGWALSAAQPMFAANPWKRHTIDRSSRGADGVRLADVNGDGLLDIATGWEEGGRIRIYVNPGAKAVRETWPAVTVGEVKSPEDAVLVDLDGDGAVDVISSCEGGNRTMFVHWAPQDPDRYLDAAAWQTDALPCTAKQQSWMFAVATNVDGRHGPDLIVGSKGKDAAVGWLESPEQPRRVEHWKYHRLRDSGWIMSLQLHDFDRDGRRDVLVSDRRGAKRGAFWLRNPGEAAVRSGAAWRETTVGGGDREVMFLTRANLVDDALPEVICAVRGSGLAIFQPHDAKHQRWRVTEAPLPADCGTGKGVAVGDIDGDGRADLVFTCENARGAKSGVRWLGRDASGGWRDHEISGPQGVKFDRVELLDLDKDGDLDVLTCEERDNLGVVWYENPRE